MWSVPALCVVLCERPRGSALEVTRKLPWLQERPLSEREEPRLARKCQWHKLNKPFNEVGLRDECVREVYQPLVLRLLTALEWT